MTKKKKKSLNLSVYKATLTPISKTLAIKGSYTEGMAG
jgi:hypothetical protein